MTATLERPATTGTAAPMLTRRTMAHWANFKTADGLARKRLASHVHPCDLAALETLEANLQAAGDPETWWYEIRGGAEERIMPMVLNQLLAGLRLTEDAVPDVCRALCPAGERRAYLELDLVRRVWKGGPEPSKRVPPAEHAPSNRVPPAERASESFLPVRNAPRAETPPASPPAPPAAPPRPAPPPRPEPAPAPPVVNVFPPGPVVLPAGTDPFEEEEPMPAPALLNGHDAQRVALMEQGDTYDDLLHEPGAAGLKELLEIHTRRLGVNFREKFDAATVRKLADLTGHPVEKVHRGLREIRQARGIFIMPRPAPSSKPEKLSLHLEKLQKRLAELKIDISRVVPDKTKAMLAQEFGTSEKAIGGAITDLRNRQNIEVVDRTKWRRPAGPPPGDEKPFEYPDLDLPKGTNIAAVWGAVVERQLDLRQQTPFPILLEMSQSLGIDPDQVKTSIGKLRTKLGLKAPAGGYRGHVPPRKGEAPPTSSPAPAEPLPARSTLTDAPAPTLDAQARETALLLVRQVATVAGDDKEALLRALSLMERIV